MFHIELKGEYFSLRRRRRGDKSVCCVFQSKKMQTLRMKEIPFLQVSATGPGPYIHLAALHQNVQRYFSLLKRKWQISLWKRFRSLQASVTRPDQVHIHLLGETKHHTIDVAAVRNCILNQLCCTSLQCTMNWNAVVFCFTLDAVAFLALHSNTVEWVGSLSSAIESGAPHRAYTSTTTTNTTASVFCVLCT